MDAKIKKLQSQIDNLQLNKNHKKKHNQHQ